MAKFFLMVLSVLGANLLSGVISTIVLGEVRSRYSVATATIVGMMVLVCLLYPLYRYLNTWVTLISDRLLRAGKKVLGRTVGLIVVFLVIVAALCYGYGRFWFGVNIYALILRDYRHLL